MKKYILDMKVTENCHLHKNYCLLKLTSDGNLPEMLPGQFVEVHVENSPTTFLRRPISVNYVDKSKNELWLLIQLVGDGTRKMAEFRPGDIVNIMLPLGNSFTIPSKEQENKRLLLIGARSKDDVLQLDEFQRFGKVYITTEDGSLGEKGYVTNHTILKEVRFDQIYTCGPKPMMVAVAKYAGAEAISCEVSLENTMACGIGACLCCVEKNKEGHNVCVCTEGPVFNIEKLSWLN